MLVVITDVLDAIKQVEVVHVVANILIIMTHWLLLAY